MLSIFGSNHLFSIFSETCYYLWDTIYTERTETFKNYYRNNEPTITFRECGTFKKITFGCCLRAEHENGIAVTANEES